MNNSDIPIEAAVKWLIRERDRYKEKLEQLIPYTKSLEKKLFDKEREIEQEHDSLLTKQDKRITELTNQRESLKAELEAFRSDFKQTQWYIQLDGDRNRLRKENKALRKALNRLLSGEMIKDDE